MTSLDELDEAVLPVPPSERESVAEPPPKQKPPPHSRECERNNKGNPWARYPTGGCEGCVARGWYPEGQGEITIRQPDRFPGTPLKRGRRW